LPAASVIAPGAGAGFGLWSFVGKLTLAFAAGVLLPAAAGAGLRRGPRQQRRRAWMLTVLYALVPCALKLVAIGPAACHPNPGGDVDHAHLPFAADRHGRHAGVLGPARPRDGLSRADAPRDYANGPRFDLRQHLNGPILCEGVIYGPTGRVTSRFVADFDARWDGNVGVMTERFRYDSGAVQDREWTLTLGNDGNIKATAPDVVGEGRGQAEGSGVQLNYRIRLTPEAGGHVLTVTDWMYLMENGTIMNRSQFTQVRHQGGRAGRHHAEERRMRDWHGKRYWLVGASEGLGRRWPKLSAAGAEVILSARSAERLAEVAAEPARPVAGGARRRGRRGLGPRGGEAAGRSTGWCSSPGSTGRWRRRTGTPIRSRRCATSTSPAAPA
jgi:hypothetical protein